MHVTHFFRTVSAGETGDICSEVVHVILASARYQRRIMEARESDVCVPQTVEVIGEVAGMDASPGEHHEGHRRYRECRRAKSHSFKSTGPACQHP